MALEPDPVDSIAGPEGFWKVSTRRAFREAFDELLVLGMPRDQAIELLNSLYDAAASEFGA